MAPNSPKSGAKRGAEEAKLDAQEEVPAPATRRTRASGNPESAGLPNLPERIQRTSPGTGPSGATAAPSAPPADEPSGQAKAPVAPIESQMNTVNIVQELNSLMLSLHSRAIENQQESSSLLAEITRLQTVYNAWVRDVILRNASPGAGEQPAAAAAAPPAAPLVQQQEQESLVDLANSVIYPGSQPLGGVAVDSDEHIAQIEHTTALVKAEIERLKVVLEEKKKAKLKQLRERGNVTLTPELVALLEKRHTPASADGTHLQPLGAAMPPPPTAQQQPLCGVRAQMQAPPVTTGQWLPKPATTQPDLSSHLGMQAPSVLERRQSDLANNPSIEGLRNALHMQQQNQRQQQQQQPLPAQHNELLQQLLQHTGISAPYTNPLGSGNFTGLSSVPAGGPSMAASALPYRSAPIRVGQQQRQQQQQQQPQLSQQQLDLVATLAEHANIQIDPSGAPRQQHQQATDGPVGQQQEAQASANFAAMLLDMMAAHAGEDGGFGDGGEDGQ